jgi:DNA-binding MarR family transcriptional regulator
MVLCCLRDKRLSSGEIADEINLTCSNTSKLLRSVEEKGYISRVLGERDKRQMYFELTKTGMEKLEKIEHDNIQLSEPLNSMIKPLI